MNGNKSVLQCLLDELLWDIYGKVSVRGKITSSNNSSDASSYECRNFLLNSSWKYTRELLNKQSIQTLTQICADFRIEIRVINSYLTRSVIIRDKYIRKQQMLCDVITKCLILHSELSLSDSKNMKFSLSPPSPPKGELNVPAGTSSDFNQWLHAMKMVARLPGGMPPEFRRKLWLALADKYLQTKNVDWEKEQEKCFSEQWREDDEELGIQIVKDLHRTGSSLCSGPAGTINQAKLKRVLLGYARWNPEVGYCQGFNMLGALILQVMDKSEAESMKVMIYLVEGILPPGYFCGSLGGLQADMAVFRELMTSKLPGLARHLQKLQGPLGEGSFEPPLTNVFTMQWFLTLFCTCLPINCVLRVWDLVLIEGSDVLLRTALAIWSLLEKRILTAKSADDFYCKMGMLSGELLNGHLIDSNGLIEKVVELGPIPELQKLRDKHLYNIAPWRDKKGLRIFYSDDEGDSDDDSRLAVTTAWGLRMARRGSTGMPIVTRPNPEGRDRIALDISLLKKQYDRLRERQRQAHIILTAAVARQGVNQPPSSSLQMNQLLVGRSAILTNKGRRIGPPQGAIPPVRKLCVPKAAKSVPKQVKRGETLHWRDTDIARRRKGSIKWKDVNMTELEEVQLESLKQTASAGSSTSSASEKSQASTSSRGRKCSESSSYSEDSDANSSTSTSLCDDDENEPSELNISSLEASPIRKRITPDNEVPVDDKKRSMAVESSRKTTDHINRPESSQIPLIELSQFSYLQDVDTDLTASLKDIADANADEDSAAECDRLGKSILSDIMELPMFEKDSSSPDQIDKPVEQTGDYLGLPSSSLAITSTSQLSPIADISQYLSTSSISPLKTPSTFFDYSDMISSSITEIDNEADSSDKFDVNEEGVTNEYFERVNIVERPNRLDLMYSFNDIEFGSNLNPKEIERTENISDRKSSTSEIGISDAVGSIAESGVEPITGLTIESNLEFKSYSESATKPTISNSQSKEHLKSSPCLKIIETINLESVKQPDRYAIVESEIESKLETESKLYDKYSFYSETESIEKTESSKNSYLLCKTELFATPTEEKPTVDLDLKYQTPTTADLNLEKKDELELRSTSDYLSKLDLSTKSESSDIFTVKSQIPNTEQQPETDYNKQTFLASSENLLIKEEPPLPVDIKQILKPDLYLLSDTKPSLYPKSPHQLQDSELTVDVEIEKSDFYSKNDIIYNTEVYGNSDLLSKVHLKTEYKEEPTSVPEKNFYFKTNNYDKGSDSNIKEKLYPNEHFTNKPNLYLENELAQSVNSPIKKDLPISMDFLNKKDKLVSSEGFRTTDSYKTIDFSANDDDLTTQGRLSAIETVRPKKETRTPEEAHTHSELSTKSDLFNKHNVPSENTPKPPETDFSINKSYMKLDHIESHCHTNEEYSKNSFTSKFDSQFETDLNIKVDSEDKLIDDYHKKDFLSENNKTIDLGETIEPSIYNSAKDDVSIKSETSDLQSDLHYSRNTISNRDIVDGIKSMGKDESKLCADEDYLTRQESTSHHRYAKAGQQSLSDLYSSNVESKFSNDLEYDKVKRNTCDEAELSTKEEMPKSLSKEIEVIENRCSQIEQSTIVSPSAAVVMVYIKSPPTSLKKSLNQYPSLPTSSPSSQPQQNSKSPQSTLMDTILSYRRSPINFEPENKALDLDVPESIECSVRTLSSSITPTKNYHVVKEKSFSFDDSTTVEKQESRPTSCPEARANITESNKHSDRVHKIIEENSKILHRILNKNLSTVIATFTEEVSINRSESDDDKTEPTLDSVPIDSEHSLLDSISSRTSTITEDRAVCADLSYRSVTTSETIRDQYDFGNDSKLTSYHRPADLNTITSTTAKCDLKTDDNIADQLASIKNTIKSIDSLCDERSSYRKEKCQRYIDSLFEESNRSIVKPVTPTIQITDTNCSDNITDDSDSLSKLSRYSRDMKRDISPRRRRDEEREEYVSRVRRDNLPVNLDKLSDSTLNSGSFDDLRQLKRRNQNDSNDSLSEDSNHNKKIGHEFRSSPVHSPTIATNYDISPKRDMTPASESYPYDTTTTTSNVYVPAKIEIRHTTVTSTFYDRYLSQKRERYSKTERSPPSPTITREYLDSLRPTTLYTGDRSAKSAESSPSRQKFNSVLTYTPTTPKAFTDIADSELHIRSCDNILCRLESDPKDFSPTNSYCPFPNRNRQPSEIGVQLGLYKSPTKTSPHS